MNTIDSYKKWVDDLLKSSNDWVVAASQSNLGATELYALVRAASLSFIRSLYTESHPHFRTFSGEVTGQTYPNAVSARGILNAIKYEMDNGYLTSMRGLVAADIFGDFVDMAQSFIDRGHKDPAAVLIGCVLEEHLRNLSESNGIATTITKDGKTVAKYAETMNEDLKKQQVYDENEKKLVSAWLGIRTSAAHARWNQFDESQVTNMVQGITGFMARNPLK